MTSNRNPSDNTLLVDSSSPVGTMAKPVDPATLPRAPLAKITPAAPVKLPPRPGTIPCPKPGVHLNVPFEDYCRWDALNHTLLRNVATSLCHFMDVYTHPDEDTDSDSKRFGRGSHTLILEPAKFNTHVWKERPPNNKTTQEAYGTKSKAYQDWAATCPKGKMIFNDEELADLMNVSKAVMGHPEAKDLLTRPGSNEVSIVWVCEITGLLCKARIDRVVHGIARVDLKSTDSAHPDDFSKSLVKFGYATQEDFYRRGSKACGMPEDIMLFVAVESSRPHAVSVFLLGEDTRCAARNLVSTWLHKVKAAIDAGIWPAFSDKVHVLDAPEWWFKSFNNGDKIE